MVKFGGCQYHLSTIAVVTMQQQDTNADGVPYISPSNKLINASSVVVKAGTAIAFDEVSANSLNKVGITTVNLVRGALRLWGPHMANYDYDAVDNILPEDRTDSSVRMMQYLLNTLQYQYLDSVDKPFSRRDIDSIKASVQQWLNGLVNEGKLLYATVDFSESNSTGDIVDGDFIFDVATTTTPNAKSLTFRVQYSLAGLASLAGGE
jgi:phage tail sheath protein FI